MNDRKIDIGKMELEKNIKYPNLKGGMFVGEGSYGCVVSPALPCSKKDKSNLKTYVSKIIIDPSEADVQEELKISKIIKTIDPTQKYFLTINKNCDFKSLNKRTDIELVRFKAEKKEYISQETSHEIKSKDENRCLVDLSKNPINIIMPNGGISLFDVLHDKQTNMTCKLINKLYIKNIDKCLKYLLEGIKLMHSNNIVNRDIKDENITLLLEKEKVKTQYKSIHSVKTMKSINKKKQFHNRSHA